MYCHPEVDTPCSDNMQIVRIGFGSPAGNDTIVRDAVQAIEQISPWGDAISGPRHRRIYPESLRFHYTERSAWRETR